MLIGAYVFFIVDHNVYHYKVPPIALFNSFDWYKYDNPFFFCFCFLYLFGLPLVFYCQTFLNDFVTLFLKQWICLMYVSDIWEEINNKCVLATKRKARIF